MKSLNFIVTISKLAYHNSWTMVRILVKKIVTTIKGTTYRLATGEPVMYQKKSIEN